MILKKNGSVENLTGVRTLKGTQPPSKARGLDEPCT
jgi:hypothetical protein